MLRRQKLRDATPATINIPVRNIGQWVALCVVIIHGVKIDPRDLRRLLRQDLHLNHSRSGWRANPAKPFVALGAAANPPQLHGAFQQQALVGPEREDWGRKLCRSARVVIRTCLNAQQVALVGAAALRNRAERSATIPSPCFQRAGAAVNAPGRQRLGDTIPLHPGYYPAGAKVGKSQISSVDPRIVDLAQPGAASGADVQPTSGPELDLPYARPVELPWAMPARVAPVPSPLEVRGVSWMQALTGVLITVGLALFTLEILPPIVAMAWLLIERPMQPDWQPSAEIFVFVVKLGCAVTAVITLGALVRGFRIPPSSFGLRRDGLGQQLLWSIPALMATYGAVILIGLVLVFTVMGPDPESELRQRMEFLDQLGLTSPVLTVVTILCVAMHEEIIFRGLLLPFLRRTGFPWWLAIAFSSGLFGLLHFPQGWTAMVQITGVAIVLSLTFVLTRSLLTVIVAHTLFNLAQIALATNVLKHLMPAMEQAL